MTFQCNQCDVVKDGAPADKEVRPSRGNTKILTFCEDCTDERER